MTPYVSAEIASQPDCWRRAAALAPQLGDHLPADGERVAFVGCGTSWFVGQALAVLRESSGRGESDAFTASEMPDRAYDRIVALTRSGTTSEVVELLERVSGRIPTTVVLGDLDTPARHAADRVVDLSFADEQSVVQTRFATSTLALCRAAWGTDVAALADQADATLTEPLPDAVMGVDQLTFLGRGWTVGIAHEAALKFRESSSSWAESYPAFDYRHGPIAIAQRGRAVWMFGEVPDGLAAEVAATGAAFVHHERDALVDLVLAQRVAVQRALDLGLDPDRPRSLTRSVILD
ncbi:MAG TPA: sugar isomerase [Microlunatus sp.]|jgi:fructoselysine-6-P-deglycase FrlB-like protein|nr:sugar isomerase [Microlunatus sp.]